MKIGIIGAMDVEMITAAPAGHRQAMNAAIVLERNEADQRFVDDGLDCGTVVMGALRPAVDFGTGAGGYR